MNNHRIDNNEFKIDIDYSVEANLKPFKEEVLDQVYSLYKVHGNIPVLFSGGNDSTFILRVLLELGITPHLVTFDYDPLYQWKSSNRARDVCKSLSLKEPEFFHLDIKKLIEHSTYLINEKNIAYPMIHAFILDYILSVYKDTKFYSGFGAEFKFDGEKIRIVLGPWLGKQNNPGRLFDFVSSRTFLSYINHPAFVSNYKTPLRRVGNDMFGKKDHLHPSH